MQRNETYIAGSQESERACQQCGKTKLLTAFSHQKGKTDERKKICCECESFKQYERRCRVAFQRERWQQQHQERTEERQKEWERSIALRKIQEERWRERERWHLQQPDRRCAMCRQLLPASAFESSSSVDGFVLYTRCKTCHHTLLERRLHPCCLCQKKTPRCNFLSHFDGYVLSGNGTAISLCCKGCEEAFLELSELQQRMFIRLCCQRTFPTGQVIYAEVDPETHEVRYIGRTGRPERRHAQHLRDASPTVRLWGAAKKAWYTRGNWIQALSDKGLKPSMQIFQTIEISPLVVEWEQRYIWHGIQQGWRLLNGETMDEGLVARIKAASFDFLKVPFEMLVQQHFFSSRGLAAFLRSWYQSEHVPG